MSWKTVRLKDVADLTLGKMLDDKKNKGTLLPYLANVNVRWGAIELDDLREMRFEPHEIERFGVKPGDIVMCEGGEPGRCAIWGGEQPIMIQKALHRIRPLDGLNNKFLFYSFLHKGMRGGFAPLFTGSTIKHLPKEKLELVEINVPSAEVQERIVSILSAYDDLIENNRRRIQLLEQSARLLYKEWFVHLRFPGHEHVKVKDGVPEGWGIRGISEVCETVGGGTPSTKQAENWDGDIPWVVPSDITQNDCLALLDTERKITEKGLRESSAKMLPPNAILMTSRASVGYFALADYAVCTNQGFISIIPHEEEMRMFLLFNLLSRVEEIRSNAKGTTFPEISKGRFRDMTVMVPNLMLVRQFSEISTGIIHQVRTLAKATSKLAKARDLLLPRLMSGELAA